MRDVVASAPILGVDGSTKKEVVRVRTSRTPGVRVFLSSMNEGEPLALVTQAVKIMQRLAMAGPWAQTAAGVHVEVEQAYEGTGLAADLIQTVEAADAAAALVACNALWNLALREAQLLALAQTLNDRVASVLSTVQIESNEAL
ncbi:hypothetical protein [Schaalia vaccimaxillae]|uniref:hypothetical protein n=1 Tax=Schaalia vaccimaxillae TaxID=183916 RepID=UPI0003B775D6|nr:hypothetical protein [Schaalia vaccimaxillae]